MSTYKLLDHSFRRSAGITAYIERNGMAAIYEQREPQNQIKSQVM